MRAGRARSRASQRRPQKNPSVCTPYPLMSLLTSRTPIPPLSDRLLATWAAPRKTLTYPPVPPDFLPYPRMSCVTSRVLTCRPHLSKRAPKRVRVGRLSVMHHLSPHLRWPLLSRVMVAVDGGAGIDIGRSTGDTRPPAKQPGSGKRRRNRNRGNAGRKARRLRRQQSCGVQLGAAQVAAEATAAGGSAAAPAAAAGGDGSVAGDDAAPASHPGRPSWSP